MFLRMRELRPDILLQTDKMFFVINKWDLHGPNYDEQKAKVVSALRLCHSRLAANCGREIGEVRETPACQDYSTNVRYVGPGCLYCANVHFWQVHLAGRQRRCHNRRRRPSYEMVSRIKSEGARAAS